MKLSTYPGSRVWAEERSREVLSSVRAGEERISPAPQIKTEGSWRHFLSLSPSLICGYGYPPGGCSLYGVVYECMHTRAMAGIVRLCWLGTCGWTTLLGLLTAAAQSDDSNVTVAGCQELLVPMCRGLVDYTHAYLPNRFNHTSQREVYWALQPWWPFMDMGCSDNLRNFLCATYLPRCVPSNNDNEHDEGQKEEMEQGEPPCQGTCRKAKQRCSALTQRQGMQWGRELDCEGLPNYKKSKACVKQKRETNKKRWRRQMECQPNPLHICQHLPYTLGSLPNPFMQA